MKCDSDCLYCNTIILCVCSCVCLYVYRLYGTDDLYRSYKNTRRDSGPRALAQVSLLWPEGMISKSCSFRNTFRTPSMQVSTLFRSFLLCIYIFICSAKKHMHQFHHHVILQLLQQTIHLKVCFNTSTLCLLCQNWLTKSSMT